MQNNPIMPHQPASPLAMALTLKAKPNGTVRKKLLPRPSSPYGIHRRSIHLQVLQCYPLVPQNAAKRNWWCMSQQNSAPVKSEQKIHRGKNITDTGPNYDVPVKSSKRRPASNSSAIPPKKSALKHRSTLSKGDHMGLLPERNAAHPSRQTTTTPIIPATSSLGSTTTSANQTASSTLCDWSLFSGYDFFCVFCLETLPTRRPGTPYAAHFKQHLQQSRYCYGKNLQFLRDKFDQGVEDADDPLLNGQVKCQLVCRLCKAALQANQYRLASPDLIAPHMQRYHPEIRSHAFPQTNPFGGS
ncbi:uncharacterized protein LOC129582340 isoform X2 [Paramacrobiotus metropolitanus]|nr:uncharacterized protein LOC129582340 isoform X2 [Paramacrobiotus metropolitanus]XP_055329826.1 uncharacterized protein LOC129582340 isoform X2 [Paramacrobiotus metropolitanus]